MIAQEAQKKLILLKLIVLKVHDLINPFAEESTINIWKAITRSTFQELKIAFKVNY